MSMLIHIFSYFVIVLFHLRTLFYFNAYICSILLYLSSIGFRLLDYIMQYNYKMCWAQSISGSHKLCSSKLIRQFIMSSNLVCHLSANRCFFNYLFLHISSLFILSNTFSICIKQIYIFSVSVFLCLLYVTKFSKCTFIGEF